MSTSVSNVDEWVTLWIQPRLLLNQRTQLPRQNVCLWSAEQVSQNKVAEVGQLILHNESIPDQHISLEAASAIYKSGNMTKRVYTEIQRLLKDAGADVLPPYDKLLKFK